MWNPSIYAKGELQEHSARWVENEEGSGRNAEEEGLTSVSKAGGFKSKHKSIGSILGVEIKQKCVLPFGAKAREETSLSSSLGICPLHSKLWEEEQYLFSAWCNGIQAFDRDWETTEAMATIMITGTNSIGTKQRWKKLRTDLISILHMLHTGVNYPHRLKAVANQAQ